MARQLRVRRTIAPLPNRVSPVGMKSVLPEWYGHDDETLELIVTTGTIALDANVMLDLYRVGRDQREQILAALGAVSDRLFVPFQAANEFLRNRLTVVESVENVYKALLDGFKLEVKQLESLRDEELRTQVRGLLKEATAAYKAGLEKLRDEHIVPFDCVRNGEDPVLDALEALLTDQTLGSRPPAEVLDTRRALALARIDAGIPPGYEDAGKKPDPTGDYLIWAELLEHAKSSGRPLLLVTNDVKDDWYRPRVRGQGLGPRTELIIEMREASPDHPYHQVPLNLFLKLSNKYLETEVDESTIETVEKITRENVIKIEDLRREAAATVASGYPISRPQFDLAALGLGQTLAGLGHIDIGSLIAPGVASNISSLINTIASLDPDMRSNLLESPGMRDVMAKIERDQQQRLEGIISPARLASTQAIANATRVSPVASVVPNIATTATGRPKAPTQTPQTPDTQRVTKKAVTKKAKKAKDVGKKRLNEN